MTEATLMVGFEDTGLPRRGMLKTTLLLAGGALATIPLVYLVGSMLKKPGDQLMHTLFSPNKELFPESGGRVPLVYSDFRRVSPGDLRAGGLATVFPGVHQTNQYGKNGITDANSPVLLIRLHAGQKVKSRPGQESYQWGDYVAYSKICTHAGCPASLYEQQTTRLLCPCHQSQFEVLEDAKPVFGPASRPLPKLPLGVVTGEDGVQYFVAKADFKEPVGPGFWDRKDYP